MFAEKESSHFESRDVTMQPLSRSRLLQSSGEHSDMLSVLPHATFPGDKFGDRQTNRQTDTHPRGRFHQPNPNNWRIKHKSQKCRFVLPPSTANTFFKGTGTMPQSPQSQAPAPAGPGIKCSSTIELHFILMTRCLKTNSE